MPGKLYWLSDKRPPVAGSDTKSSYFCVDGDLLYKPFYRDFGPLDIGKVHLFCQEIQKLVNNQEYNGRKIYHYTSKDYAHQANSAFLMAAYMIIIEGKTADEAWEKFKPYHHKFVAYVDASQADKDYECTILHCLKGLELAIKLGWYDYETFDVEDY